MLNWLLSRGWATAAEQALTDRINNVLSNIDPAMIVSFSEVVVALGSSGGNLATAVNDEVIARQADVASLQGQLNEIKQFLLTLQQGYSGDDLGLVIVLPPTQPPAIPTIPTVTLPPLTPIIGPLT